MTRPFTATLLVAILLAVMSGAAATGPARRFLSDDPLLREPDTQDAAATAPWKIDLLTDLALNLFVRMGDKTPDAPSGNVNTIDEVPDSSWFTNRIGTRPVTLAQAVNGPIEHAAPAPGRWMVIASKTSGFAPGFTMRDATGAVWFVSFDAAGLPEAATGAVMVANRLFWTLGYWQAENHLIVVRRDQLEIAETARFTPLSGKERRMKPGDLDDVFARAARAADGGYRAVAALALPGKNLGGFRYYGTRPDDPNDLVPHEHRRELRALKVFGAWTNLVDMKAGNTLDALITDNGKSVVRHYLQDVGSTFGTGANGPREYDEGYEYLVDLGLLAKRFALLGFPIAPWATVDYETNDAIGRFEGDAFDPAEWRPRVPTGAFLSARADDNFWAARRVAAFTDEMIRAIVKAGAYSNANDEKLLADTLIKRRDKIAKTYLNAMLPLVDWRLSAEGRLSFTNAAVAAGVATPPMGGYRASWASFNNDDDTAAVIGGAVQAGGTEIAAPAALATTPGSLVKISVAAPAAEQASWHEPVHVYFRQIPSGWQLVGVERIPAK